MPKRRLVLVATVLAVLAAREAQGDILHVESPSTLKTDKGSELRLPPGYFLDEDTWHVRDTELKTLQDQRTRLVAENQSLRKSASGHPWLTIIGSSLGIALGVYLAVK